MVNATINPSLQIPAQVVRLRVLNASSQRVFNLGLDQNRSFYQIASDGGLLNNAESLTRLMMAPGERAELLIDASSLQGQTIYLKSYASELPNGIYGAAQPGMGQMMTLNNYSPNAMNGADFDILTLSVVAPTSNPINSIPSTLENNVPLDESSSNITRTITMTPLSMGQNALNGTFLLNGASFDMNVINYNIPLNNTEIWTLVNQSPIAHPFHIHDVQFYILDRNGVPPGPSEQGRKDVVLVKTMETVRFIAKFEDFSNDTIPYMYHCHMTPHEDGGMMGQFLVNSPLTNIGCVSSLDTKIFPNPTSNSLLIESEKQFDDYLIYDQKGRIMAHQNINGNFIDVSKLSSGHFYLKLMNSTTDHIELKSFQIIR